MPSDGCQLAGLVRKRFVGQCIGIAESSVLGRGVGVKSLVTLEITAWAKGVYQRRKKWSQGLCAGSRSVPTGNKGTEEGL